MKSVIITVLIAAGALLAAVRSSGQSLDAGSAFAVLTASFLTALFVRDYRTPPGPARHAKKVVAERPAKPAAAVAATKTVPVFAPVRGVMVTARFASASRAATKAVSLGSS